MKDVIISEKARKEEMLSEGIVDMIAPTKVARISNPVDFTGRYN